MVNISQLRLAIKTSILLIKMAKWPKVVKRNLKKYTTVIVILFC